MQVVRRLGNDCIAHLDCNLNLRRGKKTISDIVIENIVIQKDWWLLTLLLVDERSEFYHFMSKLKKSVISEKSEILHSIN